MPKRCASSASGAPLKIGISYLRAQLFPRRNEKTLEDFLINRFGTRALPDVLQVVYGKSLGRALRPDQRRMGSAAHQGLSLSTAVAHFSRTTFSRKKTGDIAQKATETSLIEKFLYPKLGPASSGNTSPTWLRKRAAKCAWAGAPHKLHMEGNRVVSVDAVDASRRTAHTIPADYVFSTMPVRELIRSLDVEVPAADQGHRATA